MGLQHVEGPGQVPEVLGQRIPPPHDLVDQVGVAGVVVLGVPVGPLAEAPEVRGQDHMPPAGQLGGVVAPRGGLGIVETTDPGLPRSVPVDGQDGRPGCTAPVGHQQIGRHRHVHLGVEDDPGAHGTRRRPPPRSPPPRGAPARATVPGRPADGRRTARTMRSNSAGSSGSPSVSSMAARRLTAWYQGEKFRRGVGNMAGDTPLGTGGRPTGPQQLAEPGPIRPGPIGPGPRARHPRCHIPVERGPAVGHTGPMAVDSQLDVRPLSPLIGAEIHGLDLARPLTPTAGRRACGRPSTPTTWSSSATRT